MVKIMNKEIIYYVIDRTDPEFWDFEKFDDYLSALEYKRFLDDNRVTITCNKIEIIQLCLYAKVKDISVRIGSGTYERTI